MVVVCALGERSLMEFVEPLCQLSLSEDASAIIGQTFLYSCDKLQQYTHEGEILVPTHG